METPLNVKIQKLIEQDFVATYPSELIDFKPYSKPVQEYIKACRPAVIQGVRIDMRETRDPIEAGNRAYAKVEVFKPVFAQMALCEGSDPEDAELMRQLTCDWIVETLTICQTCPATKDPKKCTGLCSKWGIVPR